MVEFELGLDLLDPCVLAISPLQAKEEFFSAGSDSLMGSVATTGDGESSHKDGDGEECNPLDSGSGKWMSSKMRFMRKMTGSDKITSGRPRKNALGSNDHLRQFAENNVNSDNQILPNGSIRVCSECNTTKTPLWRSGPGGPKVSPLPPVHLSLSKPLLSVE